MTIHCWVLYFFTWILEYDIQLLIHKLKSPRGWMTLKCDVSTPPKKIQNMHRYSIREVRVTIVTVLEIFGIWAHPKGDSNCSIRKRWSQSTHRIRFGDLVPLHNLCLLNRCHCRIPAYRFSKATNQKFRGMTRGNGGLNTRHSEDEII